MIQTLVWEVMPRQEDERQKFMGPNPNAGDFLEGGGAKYMLL